MEDAAWLISAGVGDTEDWWENFHKAFKEVFEISYEEAKNLNLF